MLLQTHVCNNRIIDYVFVLLDETELNTLHPISRNGKIVLVSEELKKKLEHEHSTWHWTPWLRTRVEINEDGVAQQTCPAGDSIESFPDSIFTGM